MTRSDWLAAIGSVLVIEGILPFVLPGVWRNALRRMLELRDGQLRFIGATSMLGGLFVLTMLN
ncbi:MAG: DUF2065 domain-containing protein [Hydrogenophilales bacterium]|nr:DUF2065 domain-containing protein [Hydrogenophilales bacterium]